MRADVVCPTCGDWREDEISDEEYTASTIDCNPIVRRCAPCEAEYERRLDVEMSKTHPHLGCCGH